MNTLVVAVAVLYVGGGAYTGRLAYQAHMQVCGCWWQAERAAYRAGMVWPLVLPFLVLVRVVRGGR